MTDDRRAVLRVTGPYQTIESRSTLPPLSLIGAVPQTPGAQAYFSGGSIPPNTDQAAWQEIWDITHRLTEAQRQTVSGVAGQATVRPNLIKRVLGAFGQ